MASFNRVILVGNLTRDPQLKYLPNNTAVCEFGLAVNHRWRDKEGNQRDDVCFVDIAAFSRQGELINQYMTKGRPILIEGRLKLDQWTDKEGNKRSKHSVVVENFTFLGSAGGGGGDSGGGAPANRGNYERGPSQNAPSQRSQSERGGYDRPAAAAPAYDPGPDSYSQAAPADDGPPRGDDIPF